ncbi:glycosyltransferase [SAR92 clade bacterium H231]|nr:glycosyltransferase [SAR92 clade bacterium H231]
MLIKFSIVLPALNSEKYIGEALESLRNQTYVNFELIVCDGGSTDRTLEIIDANRDLVDVLISGPDSGQSDAFNKGFASATGDYYLWLNSDDIMHPMLLESAHNFLVRQPDALWLNFGTVIIDELSRICEFFSAPNWMESINKNFRPQISSPTTIFHNSLMKRLGGFDERFHYAMDVDLWRTFVEAGFRWHKLAIYGIGFRRHGDSKTNSHILESKPEQINESKLMFEKHHFDLLSKSNLYRAKIWRFVNCWFKDLFFNGLWRKDSVYRFFKRL